jgi:hypothetical protein
LPSNWPMNKPGLETGVGAVGDSNGEWQTSLFASDNARQTVSDVCVVISCAVDEPRCAIRDGLCPVGTLPNPKRATSGVRPVFDKLGIGFG